MKGNGVKEREEPKHEERGNNVGHSCLTLNAEETNSAPARRLAHVWCLEDQPETCSDQGDIYGCCAHARVFLLQLNDA